MEATNEKGNRITETFSIESAEKFHFLFFGTKTVDTPILNDTFAVFYGAFVMHLWPLYGVVASPRRTAGAMMG
jgi:hypothetical protein